MGAPCRDCGRDTTPVGGHWEWYMITAALWGEAGMEPRGGFLCIDCLETRLGRELTASDFADVPLNEPSSLDTWELADAKLRGGTERGSGPAWIAGT